MLLKLVGRPLVSKGTTRTHPPAKRALRVLVRRRARGRAAALTGRRRRHPS